MLFCVVHVSLWVCRHAVGRRTTEAVLEKTTILHKDFELNGRNTLFPFFSFREQLVCVLKTISIVTQESFFKDLRLGRQVSPQMMLVCWGKKGLVASHEVYFYSTYLIYDRKKQYWIKYHKRKILTFLFNVWFDAYVVFSTGYFISSHLSVWLYTFTSSFWVSVREHRPLTKPLHPLWPWAWCPSRCQNSPCGSSLSFRFFRNTIIFFLVKGTAKRWGFLDIPHVSVAVLFFTGWEYWPIAHPPF